MTIIAMTVHYFARLASEKLWVINEGSTKSRPYSAKPRQLSEAQRELTLNFKYIIIWGFKILLDAPKVDLN